MNKFTPEYPFRPAPQMRKGPPPRPQHNPGVEQQPRQASPPPPATPAINQGATDEIAERTAYYKATTPEERAARFATLASGRTRRAIRAIRLIGDLVTGYAVFNEAQMNKLVGTLHAEVDTLHKAMAAHLNKGTTIKDVEFDLAQD